MNRQQRLYIARHGRAILYFILLAWPLLLLAGSRPAVAQAVEPGAVRLATVSPYLQAQLDANSGPVSFLVVLQDQPDIQSVVAAQGDQGDGRPSKAAQIYASLTRQARQSQAPLRAWLDAHNIPYRSFYIVNAIEVWGSGDIAEALRRRSDVNRLAANPNIDLRDALETGGFAHATPAFSPLATGAQSTSVLPYGLNATKAPQVWALGYRGQNIVVASQDTGVQWDHPALKAQYRGWNSSTGIATHMYNWYDAWAINSSHDRCAADPQTPCDDLGHGTHTMGTMVGDATPAGGTVLGMAPLARWMGCRNMLAGVGSPASYMACFEFFLAPYPQNGDPLIDGRPELAPQIISNSWGCPVYEGCDAGTLLQAVNTMRAAGEFVVASAGNYGPSCSSVLEPIGLYDSVLSVGATDSSGVIANFSSRGPVTIDGSNRMKPDLTAPGVDVYSAYPTYFSFGSPYQTLSGTSMAAPHVAGAVALLWSADRDLIGQIDATEQILLKSAMPVTDSSCDGTSSRGAPNNTYGYGRLDILATVQMALNPWALAIEVTDAKGQIVTGASVTVIDALTRYEYDATTDFAGIARWPRFYSGTYAVHISTPSARLSPQSGTLDIPAITLNPVIGSLNGAAQNAQLKVAYHAGLIACSTQPSVELYLPLLIQQ